MTNNVSSREEESRNTARVLLQPLKPSALTGSPTPHTRPVSNLRVEGVTSTSFPQPPALAGFTSAQKTDVNQEKPATGWEWVSPSLRLERSAAPDLSALPKSPLLSVKSVGGKPEDFKVGLYGHAVSTGAPAAGAGVNAATSSGRNASSTVRIQLPERRSRPGGGRASPSVSPDTITSMFLTRVEQRMASAAADARSQKDEEQNIKENVSPTLPISLFEAHTQGLEDEDEDFLGTDPEKESQLSLSRRSEGALLRSANEHSC
ncbi:unnamed protein product [Amoebophrya sp. A25]|nr:unnamed protein product [Amoebophrya sp. A25]|eukprot:GSA25T00011227001.1